MNKDEKTEKMTYQPQNDDIFVVSDVPDAGGGVSSDAAGVGPGGRNVRVTGGRRGKSRKRGDRMRKMLALMFLLIFLGSGTALFFDWYQGYVSDRGNETIKDLVTSGSGTETVSGEGKTKILSKYAALYKQNNDTVGWIKIDDTPIDFVVVQTGNNDDYLRTDFDGNSNRNGTIFVDWHCPMNPMGRITVIYGHNMKREKAMFTSLRNYKKLSYYQEHPVVQFDTIYEEHQYKIFAVVLMDASPASDATDEFKLYSGFSDSVTFSDYVKSIRSHSYLDIPVKVNKSDKIIALVTCSYDFEDARYVVFARQVRDDESADVDVSAATVNEDMVVPTAIR